MQKPIQIKSPFFALLLSALVPGLGQLYNGQTGRGIVYIFTALVSIALTTIFIGFITYFAIWLVAMITAYTGARKANSRFAAQIQRQKPEKLD